MDLGEKELCGQGRGQSDLEDLGGLGREGGWRDWGAEARNGNSNSLGRTTQTPRRGGDIGIQKRWREKRGDGDKEEKEEEKEEEGKEEKRRDTRRDIGASSPFKLPETVQYSAMTNADIHYYIYYIKFCNMLLLMIFLYGEKCLKMNIIVR